MGDPIIPARYIRGQWIGWSRLLCYSELLRQRLRCRTNLKSDIRHAITSFSIQLLNIFQWHPVVNRQLHYLCTTVSHRTLGKSYLTQQVQLIGFYTNGVELTSYASGYTLVDSGTSLFFFNQNLYDQIISQFFQGCNTSSSYVQCPCSMISSFPNFTFYFQGAKAYIYNSNYTSGCNAMFGPIADLGGILLGDTFMRNYIITFDKTNSQVGFKGYLSVDSAISGLSI